MAGDVIYNIPLKSGVGVIPVTKSDLNDINKIKEILIEQYAPKEAWLDIAVFNLIYIGYLF